MKRRWQGKHDAAGKSKRGKEWGNCPASKGKGSRLKNSKATREIEQSESESEQEDLFGEETAYDVLIRSLSKGKDEGADPEDSDEEAAADSEEFDEDIGDESDESGNLDEEDGEEEEEDDSGDEEGGEDEEEEEDGDSGDEEGGEDGEEQEEEEADDEGGEDEDEGGNSQEAQPEKSGVNNSFLQHLDAELSAEQLADAGARKPNFQASPLASGVRGMTWELDLPGGAPEALCASFGGHQCAGLHSKLLTSLTPRKKGRLMHRGS
ncbi:hypothetical protein CYMTET_44703 [Cymbomonas tetramitiformis]|uniref:Uncharacterized protein n=1 Tax=Cymbomonas tetramitiformis TaxID=36881 RepID=A0AAE0BZN9_9CHLO|nr:hypothetical protein CYMTET_44703 [Cymbomonas tetramitiformis]